MVGKYTTMTVAQFLSAVPLTYSYSASLHTSSGCELSLEQHFVEITVYQRADWRPGPICLIKVCSSKVICW